MRKQRSGAITGKIDLSKVNILITCNMQKQGRIQWLKEEIS
jgi:hypothetical protein